MQFWCRQCQSGVEVRASNWRVNAVGKPDTGGQCANCGNEVLRRITKLDVAPPAVALKAQAVEATYQHWRKVWTKNGNQQIRTLAIMFRDDPELVTKLATAFSLRAKYVQSIIRND